MTRKRCSYRVYGDNVVTCRTDPFMTLLVSTASIKTLKRFMPLPLPPQGGISVHCRKVNPKYNSFRGWKPDSRKHTEALVPSCDPTRRNQSGRIFDPQQVCWLPDGFQRVQSAQLTLSNLKSNTVNKDTDNKHNCARVQPLI